MPQYEYDSVIALEQALKSLEAFNRLIVHRQTAVEGRHETLKEWIVLGRFFFDTMGNVFKYCPPFVPAEFFPNFPDIISDKDYQAYKKRYLKPHHIYPFDIAPRFIKALIPSAFEDCPECGKGWTIGNCYDAIYHTAAIRHSKCYRKYQGRTEKDYFAKVFAEAGFKEVILTQIRNPYCTVEFCPPWFVVVTDGLPITIGNWRKRLIIIICTDPRVDFEKICPNCDVTKGKDHIHAWGRNMAITYLIMIRKIIFPE